MGACSPDAPPTVATIADSAPLAAATTAPMPVLLAGSWGGLGAGDVRPRGDDAPEVDGPHEWAFHRDRTGGDDRAAGTRSSPMDAGADGDAGRVPSA